MRRRVPVRLQLTTSECGAAVLAMLLSHHGRHASVAECRDLLGPGRDGVSVARLVAAAREYGLTATAERVADPLGEPPRAPFIAYFSAHHFVVVEGPGRGGVRIVDPGNGRRTMPREEFARRYGGVVIECAPGPGFVRRRASPWRSTPVRYLRDFAAVPGGRRRLAGVLALAAAIQLLALALPLATKSVVDELVPAGRGDLLPVLGWAVFGTAALHGTLTFLRARLLLALRARADERLTGRFVGHLLRLPIGFFLQRSRGDLLLRVGSIATTREAVTQQSVTLALDMVLLSAYGIALVLLVPWYALMVGALAAGQAGLMVASYRRLRTLSQAELGARAGEQGYLVETLQAMLPLKANGVESRAQARWRELFGTYQTAMLRRGRASSWFEAAQGAVAVFAPLALLWCGAWLVLGGRMSLGTMLAVNALAMSVLAPLQAFVGTVQLYSMLRGQFERIYDVLDAAPEPSGARLLPAGRPVAIRAEGVAFRYAPDSPPVLREMSFEVPAGAKLGVVGRTGSGKSTLALLVLGLLRPETGEIRHDGVPVQELDVAALRRECGAVLQELSLFNGSIRDNITLGSPDATDDDVVTAALVAGLHHDVERLPMGYDTNVGEGGAALSAGQRQRVALARAIVHRPRLLILDEATSHLDPQTERRVDAALSELRVTRIVVSHRLSAIRDAHEVLVIDQGRIVGRGTHERLVSSPGPYRDLFGAPPVPDPLSA
ncbi:peptidase domain-containing ABC transporter [Nonomuraea sp. NPDC051941]|uniref:peptidase domain-containing ABC transporter n=1 Tax=Nonomuraea sp. NPDC051941 TaxID=3364373 RepID=UPI0037CA4636